MFIALYALLVTLIIMSSSGSQRDSSPASLYMHRAIELAKQAHGRTRPNPAVGCVIVDADGGIVGEGFHERAGCPHAEVMALTDAGNKSIGATAYVSLEPCSHYGKTPPCTLALVKSGIKRVVAGMVDPDPRVSGEGLLFLLRNGVQVEISAEGDACKQVNAGFVHRILHGRAYHVLWTGLLSETHHESSRLLLQPGRFQRLFQCVCSDVDAVVLTTEDLFALAAHEPKSENAQDTTVESLSLALQAVDVLFPPHVVLVLDTSTQSDSNHHTTRDNPVNGRLQLLRVSSILHTLTRRLLQTICWVQRMVFRRSSPSTHISSAMQALQGKLQTAMEAAQSLSSRRSSRQWMLLNHTESNPDPSVAHMQTVASTLSRMLGSNAVLSFCNSATALRNALTTDSVQRLVATSSDAALDDVVKCNLQQLLDNSSFLSRSNDSDGDATSTKNQVGLIIDRDEIAESSEADLVTLEKNTMLQSFVHLQDDEARVHSKKLVREARIRMLLSGNNVGRTDSAHVLSVLAATTSLDFEVFMAEQKNFGNEESVLCGRFASCRLCRHHATQDAVVAKHVSTFKPPVAAFGESTTDDAEAAIVSTSATSDAAHNDATVKSEYWTAAIDLWVQPALHDSES